MIQIRILRLIELTCFSLLLFLNAPLRSDEIDRSPVDLVLSKDESWLATVNQTSNSVSLVGLTDKKVLDEIQVGLKPVAIAMNWQADQLLVTSQASGDLHFLQVRGQKLSSDFKLHLGFQPHGIAVSPDGRTAYVALTDADQVVIVDLQQKSVVDRIPVGRWPRYLALSSDGSRLAVGTSGDRGVSIVDTSLKELLNIDRFVGLNIGHMQLSHDGKHVYFPWMVYRRNPITERNIRLGWVMASRLGRIGLEKTSRREAISLDPPGKAVSDPHGLALTSDERQVVISASGTHELLVFQIAQLPFQEHGSTDHIDEALLKDQDRFYRIELGGRPMGLRISQDNCHAYVANYLDNSVQVVNLVERKLAERIFLGGSSTPSLARQGEAIFFDARRSLDQWYSCHSCHYEGGTNSVVMDTQNDGTQFTFKTVLPLYQVDQTGPWTWHGWQKESKNSLRHSLKTTMLGPDPSDSDVEALLAYLTSLQSPANPWRAEIAGMEAIERGQKIFNGPNGACANCHSGPNYSDSEIHDLKLGGPNDAYVGFNTPTLNGVFRKTVLLHDGRAASLIELLSGPHAPEKVAGSKLSEGELNDLVAYLKTL